MTVSTKSGVAIVTGASGQDGFFLTKRLLSDGWTVHATSRDPGRLRFDPLTEAERSRLHTHQIDLVEPKAMFELIGRTQPNEFYNLGGQSSVSLSFTEPLYTWRTNAEAVVHLLECLRLQSPQTRFYQASSTDMFGFAPGGSITHNEESALNPQSPYASAKAAAHLLCRSYREVYDLRIACGILSNHESHRRPASFISRKVVDHVVRLRGLPVARLANAAPLAMGNLKARRDWGFAPDYVEGILRILRQEEVRTAIAGKEANYSGASYRDYLLGTGKTHAVWELVDSAFRLTGFELDWKLDGDEPDKWCADFRETGTRAVEVNASLLRTAEPLVIQVDPSRARTELGWSPQEGLTPFLSDMLNNPGPRI